MANRASFPCFSAVITVAVLALLAGGLSAVLQLEHEDAVQPTSFVAEPTDTVTDVSEDSIGVLDDVELTEENEVSEDWLDHILELPERRYRSFTVAATGDLLIHSPVRNRAATTDGYDFGPQLSAVQPDIAAADLGICHLEVPMRVDRQPSSYPIFNAPPQLATAIAETGWDVCSVASNHSADQGFDGVVSTLDVLDSAGIGHRGMARSVEEFEDPRLLEVNDTTVGWISATYGLNGLPMPGDNPWSVRLIDTEQILQRAETLRQAGAEVVIVSLHWGNEYQHTPSEYQRTIATQLLNHGAIDAIIGHHAHVVQPVEWINDRPVVFGLGNFLSGQRPAERRDGVIVNLSFVENAAGWQVENITARPTWVDDSFSVTIADPQGSTAASAERTLEYVRVPLAAPVGPPIGDVPRTLQAE